MIRVLLRRADDTDAYLIGDFPPDQIDGIEALISATEIFDGVDDPERPGRIIRQIVPADPPSTPRWCLELVWFGVDDD